MSDEAENDSQTSPLTVDKIVDERGVPLGNVLKEISRKFGRVNEINAKLDMLLQNNVPGNYSPDKGNIASGADLDPKIKGYIDASRMEDKRLEVEKAQKVALDTVFKTFPELNQSSDEFDKPFFDLAVEYESSIDKADPQRSIKAAKLAALDLGKVEKITKAKVIQDEARRTRALSEGSAPSKDNAKQTKSSTMNKSAIQKYLKIDPATVEKYAKEEG